MKTLLVIIDGLGDEKNIKLGDKTPFAYAEHPNLDALAKQGGFGMVSICENDFLPESMGCTLRILGVKQEEFPQNRACLELSAYGRVLLPEQMVLRCNLVAVAKNGDLEAFNARGLTPDTMEAIRCKAASCCPRIEFLHLSDYRNLLVTDRQEAVLNGEQVKPPHESVGEPLAVLLRPLLQQSPLLKSFLAAMGEQLKIFAAGQNTLQLYPWGPAVQTGLKSFYERCGLRGAVVCKAEIIRGIAGALDMSVIPLLRATGDIDTDLTEKAEATVAALGKYDFVFTHFNGSDEAAHRLDPAGKAKFIARIDREFFSRLLAQLNEPVKILVVGDHETSSVSGRHTAGRVPCIAAVCNGERKQYSMRNYHDIQNFLLEG